MVLFNGAQFCGGEVMFDNALFTRGMGNFGGSEFSGGTVNFTETVSFPAGFSMPLPWPEPSALTAGHAHPIPLDSHAASWRDTPSEGGSIPGLDLRDSLARPFAGMTGCPRSDKPVVYGLTGGTPNALPHIDKPAQACPPAPTAQALHAERHRAF